MVDGIGTTAYTFDSIGQLLTEDGPFASDTVTNTYQNRMRVALALQQPTGSWTNGFAWDLAKRLTNVAMSAGNFSYKYSGIQHRLITNLGLPNTSVITNGFDANARLLITSLNNSSGTPLDSYAYIYDPANERTNLSRTDASTVGFKYDKIGQLTNADSSVNSEDRGYAYDAAWNLATRLSNGVSSTFTCESRNELTNGPGTIGTCYFDFNGNLTNRSSSHFIYNYDDENRLTHWIKYASSPSSPTIGDLQTVFAYDGRGRLRWRYEYDWECNQGEGPQGIGGDPDAGGGGGTCDWVLLSATQYIYDGNRVIEERDAFGTPVVAYTRGPDLSGTFEGAGGIGGLLARSSGYSAGNWSTHNYYHADGNGNITYLVNSGQTVAATYRYDPFGNTISSSGAYAGDNVYRFSSKEFHVKSGMYYYLYRFYDPNLQRWMSKDPVEQQVQKMTKKKLKLQAVAGWNLYALCLQNPISRADTDGRNWITHAISEMTRYIGLGGTCCNNTAANESWLDNGQWKPLPPGSCTGFTDDCDGQTCNGTFYSVSLGGSASCNPSGCSTLPPVPPPPFVGATPNTGPQGPPPASLPLTGWTPGSIGISPFDRGAVDMPPGYAPPM